VFIRWDLFLFCWSWHLTSKASILPIWSWPKLFWSICKLLLAYDTLTRGLVLWHFNCANYWCVEGYNNTESMFPSTKDPWPRTVLVCAEGMVTKIKKISLRLKHECPCMGFEVSRELIPDARSGLTEKVRSPSLSLVDWLTRSMLTLWVVNLT